MDRTMQLRRTASKPTRLPLESELRVALAPIKADRRLAQRPHGP
jgi:hypothetical protein